MKKIIEKMVLALLVSLIILSINMQVFADYNDFQKLYLVINTGKKDADGNIVYKDMTLEQLVSNVNSKKITKTSAKDAIEDGKATDKFISVSCYPLFEKDTKFKKYKIFLDETRKKKARQ